jgi:uncharacterized protein (UPF0332 family)
MFENDLKNAEKNYNSALERGEIIKSKKQPAFVSSFVNFAESSLITASMIFEISKNKEKKIAMGVGENYDGSMWVVVACYFSMFYMASALLAKKGIKIGRIDTHRNVRDAFLHVYIANHTIDRELGVDYSEAKELAEDLISEREKRSKYQYEVGSSILEKDAVTSLKRARNFFEKTRLLI